MKRIKTNEFADKFADYVVWETNNGDFILRSDEVTDEHKEHGSIASVSTFASRWEHYDTFVLNELGEIKIDL